MFSDIMVCQGWWMVPLKPWVIEFHRSRSLFLVTMCILQSFFFHKAVSKSQMFKRLKKSWSTSIFRSYILISECLRTRMFWARILKFESQSCNWRSQKNSKRKMQKCCTSLTWMLWVWDKKTNPLHTRRVLQTLNWKDIHREEHHLLRFIDGMHPAYCLEQQ